MKKIFIFPCGGNALEVLDLVKLKYKIAGFIDDDIKKQRKKWNGYTVYSREIINRNPTIKVLMIPATPSSFRKVQFMIDSFGLEENRLVTLIHPKANVSKQACIGVNTVILAGTTITSNARIGNHVWISPNTVVHHDVVIEDYSVIGSGCVIAGKTSIGESCYIGSGSNIRENIQIGKKSIVGLGSNVISSFPANSKVVGNPAKAI